MRPLRQVAPKDIAIGIVAHHSRKRRAESLAKILDAEVVAMDSDGKLGAGRNHERCYEWLAEATEPWSLILEDDAVPVKNFRFQAARALSSSPTDILSLYLGRNRPPHWQPSIARVIGGDHHYLVASELLHHVAVAIRTPMIPALLAHLRNDTAYTRGKLPIDEAVGRFARTGKIPIGYVHPSLVNHDATLPTAITTHVSQHPHETGRRSVKAPRQAWAFGVRRQWSGGSVATIPDPF